MPNPARFKLSDLIKGGQRVAVMSPKFGRGKMALMFRRDKWQRKMVRKMLRAHGIPGMRLVPASAPAGKVRPAAEEANKATRKRRPFWDRFARKSQKEEPHGEGKKSR